MKLNNIKCLYHGTNKGFEVFDFRTTNTAAEFPPKDTYEMRSGLQTAPLCAFSGSKEVTLPGPHAQQNYCHSDARLHLRLKYRYFYPE